MKKLIAVMLITGSVIASEPYGDHTCPSYVDGSGDQIYLYESWISGYQAGRVGYENVTKDDRNIFIYKVRQYCVLLPGAKIINAVENVLKADS